MPDRLALALLLALVAPALGQPPPPPTTASTQAERTPVRVVRVVDGDTIVVQLDGRPTTIRLLGLDAPESVEPGKPVERGAKEAATFLRTRVEGRVVAVEFEPAARRTDGRGRSLGWIYAPDGGLVNLEAVERGYVRAYSSKAAPASERFRVAEAKARAAGLGIWGPETGKPSVPAPATAGPSGPATVYTTDRGERYHREGCSYLAKRGCE